MSSSVLKYRMRVNTFNPQVANPGLVGDLARVAGERPGVHPVLEARPGPPPLYPVLSARKLEARFGPLGQPSDAEVFRRMLQGVTGNASAR